MNANKPSREDLRPYILNSDGWKVKVIPYDSDKAKRISDSRSRSRSKSKGSIINSAQKPLNVKIVRDKSSKRLRRPSASKSSFYKEQNSHNFKSSKSVLATDCCMITVTQFGDTEE